MRVTSKIPPFFIDSVLGGPDKKVAEIMENSSQQRSDGAGEQRALCTATSHDTVE